MDTPQIQSGTPGTIPFRAAQAYGAAQGRSAPHSAATSRGLGSLLTTTDSGLKIRAVTKETDSIEISSRTPKAGGLVGAKVGGKVDFAASVPSDGSLQFYRHPADKNAAATGIDAGRRLDVNG